MLSGAFRNARLPLVVAALGAGLALAGWALLLADRRSQTVASAQAIAGDSRKALALQVHEHREALLNLSHYWGRFERRPEREWRFDSHMVIEHFPGIRWIAWLEEGRETTRVSARAQVEPPGPELADAAPAALDEPRVVGPLPGDPANPSGRFQIWIPVRGDQGSDRGALVAELDTAWLLAPVLRDSAPGYAITVRWGGTVIHQHRVASERAPDWWRAEGPVEIAPGLAWSARYVPDEQRLRQTLTPLPHFILAGGLVLAALLAMVLYQVGVTRQAVRRLAAVNRSLDGRIEEVSARDAALVELNRDLEARVEARAADLKDAVEELEAFNYSVSHDLRSPLGAILNFAALLEEDYAHRLDEGGRDMLRRIQGSAGSAMELLEGLLELSRAGQAAIRRERIDMGKLARAAWRNAATAEPERDVEIEFGDLPEAVADPVLVSDVFENLFSNALKYTRHREKARIRVDARREDGAALYWVSDNGMGFEPRLARKIFGAFDRLHDAQEFEGTGVGLAMVARIIRRHGGRTWAEGQPDRGATIYFTLPEESA